MQTIIPQQILVPKKVYIGDTAELRCTFNSPEPILKSFTENGIADLPCSSFDLIDTDDFQIKEIKLAPAGVDYYQLSIIFVPWKTGDLQFEPLVLSEHKKEASADSPDSSVTIEFQPVQIVSLISESTGTATLRDTSAPLLLPGTAYRLYGTLAAFILVLIILIRIIIKRKSLLFFINQKRLLRKYRKNKKQTIKLLRQTAQKDEGPLSAEKIQKIMRNYLEVRFDYPFTRAVTSEIMKGWQAATGGLLSEAKEEAFGDIAYSFIRTDFIRYSKNGAFEPGEIKLFIEKLIDRIEILERQEKPEGDDSAKL